MFGVGEDADSMYPMIPLDGTDPETAMAMVNSEMMVEVNMLSIVTSTFVDDAAHIVLYPGDNMPFTHVDWKAPQALVVGHEDAPGNGATFLVTPVQIGANQIPLPIGDPVPVTCGPFRCAVGAMEAPEITIEDSMACTMWEPTLELQVGLIDNSLSEHTGIAFDSTETPAVTEVTVFDGLDLGWHYTSSLGVTITHDLSVTSAEVKGVAKKSSATSLAMSSVGQITLGRTAGENDQIYYALSAENDETTGATVDTTDTEVFNPGSCQPRQHQTLWSYNDNLVSRISKPDDCFRLTVDHGLERNYLDAYTVTMAPQGADVSWGMIPWWAKRDDLKCPSMSWEAMAQVDVCAMFEEEVARLPTPEAVAVVTREADVTAASNLTGPSLWGFNLDYDGAGDDRHRFTAMWYGRGKEMPPPNLYADLTATTDFDEADMVVGATQMDTSTPPAVLATGSPEPWVKTLDKDFDPMYGDLGKVSIDGNDNADNFAMNDDSYACSADDGGTAATGTNGVDNNSTACNAEDVVIETSVTFPLGLGYGCEAVEVDYTLTCQWDARGNRKNTVGTTLAVIATDGANLADFVSCKVE